MREFTLILALSLAFVFSAATPTFSADEPPAWAYPVNPPDLKPRLEDGILRRVPGSSTTYSVTQLRDRFIAPVWHPGDHPPLPQIVAQGRKPNVFACGFCHRADGPGGPENANLAGLPAAYIVQTNSRLQEWRQKELCANKRPCCLKDIPIKGHHRRRGASGRSLFFCAETKIEYQSCRNRYRPEDICRRMVLGRLQNR